MVRHVLFGACLTIGFLALSASAAEEVHEGADRTRVKQQIVVEPPTSSDGPARVRTHAATFEVNPKNVELLRRALAGEDVEHEIYAGGVDQ